MDLKSEIVLIPKGNLQKFEIWNLKFIEIDFGCKNSNSTQYVNPAGSI